VIQKIESDAFFNNARRIRKKSLGEHEARVPCPNTYDSQDSQQREFRVCRSVVRSSNRNDDRQGRDRNRDGADDGGREFPRESEVHALSIAKETPSVQTKEKTLPK
jgi:hypothetical protein